MSMRFHCIVSALFSLFVLSLLTACIQNTPYPAAPAATLPVMPLAERVAKTELGGSITMESDVTALSEEEYIAIPRSMTISGSKENPYDMKGITLVVQYTGTELKNLSNISELIIAESLKDGDFTMENCQVNKMTVLGGGEKSIHCLASQIRRMIVDYLGVRLLLENETKVGFMRVKKNCHIAASEEVNGTISTMYVDKTVGEIVLSASISLTSVLTRSASGGDTRPCIRCEDYEAMIIEGADRDDEGNLSPLNAKGPFDEVISEDEIVVLPESAVDNIIEELENGSSSSGSGSDIGIDNPGPLSLRATRSAIVVKVAAPGNANHVDFYRAEYGTENWYFIGNIKTESRRPLEGNLSFNDYYVTAGKAYSYYAVFRTDYMGYVLSETEKDSVTATGGRGPLEISNSITVSSSGNMKLWLNKEPVLANLMTGEIFDTLISLYFKPVADKPETTIVDSSLYDNVQFENRESVKWHCISQDHLGKVMNIVALKVNVSQTVKDIHYSWSTLPKTVATGDGFTSGMIAAFPKNFPIIVTDTAQGFFCKIKNDGLVDSSRIHQIEVQTGSPYTQSSRVISARSGSVSLIAGNEFHFEEANVTAGQPLKITVVYKDYDTEKKLLTNIARFSVNFTPKTGMNIPEFSDDFAYTYDEENQKILVESDADAWFTRKDVFADSLDFIIDGEKVSLEKQKLCPGLRFTDANYSFTKTVSLSAVTVDEKTNYQADLKRTLSGYEGLILSAYRAQIQATYQNENYSINYIPCMLSSYIIPDLPVIFMLD